LKLVESILSWIINQVKEVNYIIQLDSSLRGIRFHLQGYSDPTIIKDLIQNIVKGKWKYMNKKYKSKCNIHKAV